MIIPIESIDYSNEPEVEEQSTLRRERMETAKTIQAKQMWEWEIEEIARRFVHHISK